MSCSEKCPESISFPLFLPFLFPSFLPNIFREFLFCALGIKDAALNKTVPHSFDCLSPREVAGCVPGIQHTGWAPLRACAYEAAAIMWVDNTWDSPGVVGSRTKQNQSPSGASAGDGSL